MNLRFSTPLFVILIMRGKVILKREKIKFQQLADRSSNKTRTFQYSPYISDIFPHVRAQRMLLGLSNQPILHYNSLQSPV
jgi:hypothetical protein